MDIIFTIFGCVFWVMFLLCAPGAAIMTWLLINVYSLSKQVDEMDKAIKDQAEEDRRLKIHENSIE